MSGDESFVYLPISHAEPGAVQDPSLGVLFFSAGCVIGCDIEVHNSAPDTISFSTHNPVVGLPIDAVYALAHNGVIEGIVSGMPRTTGVSPMPGDPVVTLALLPSMISINLGNGLNAKYTPLQVLAAYGSFVGALFNPTTKSSACVQAAAGAFVALAEICRLDSSHSLIPPHLRKVRLSLHSTRYSHDVKPRSFSKFGDEDNVPWNELVPGYIQRLRETPDAATGNTFSFNTAAFLWAIAKFEATNAASVGLTAAASIGSGTATDTLYVHTLSDVDLVAYFALLQYTRNRMCIDGTTKATTQILRNMVAEQLLTGMDAVEVLEPDVMSGAVPTVYSIASASNAATRAVGRIPSDHFRVMEVGRSLFEFLVLWPHMGISAHHLFFFFRMAWTCLLRAARNSCTVFA